MNLPWSRVLFPTDLWTAPAEGYALALRLALTARGELTTVHVTPDWADTDWARLPVARQMLAEWGVIDVDAGGSAIARLPLSLRLHARESRDVLETIALEARRERADVVVMSTRAPGGLSRLFGGSVASAVARRVGLPTLLFPVDARPLVEPISGKVALRRVLVAEGSAPPVRALSALSALAEGLNLSGLDVDVLHVGAQGRDGDLPAFAAGTLRRRLVAGDVASALSQAAIDGDYDLVVTETSGHDSVRDAVSGSVTERLAHQARRVVLTIPK